LDTAKIVEAIRSHRFNFTNEAELQQGIALALAAEKIPFLREQTITGAGRIDFWIDYIGVEVKIDGGRSEILRQLMRYAKKDAIHELILVTTKNRHRAMPPTINNKKLFVIYLSTGIF